MAKQMPSTTACKYRIKATHSRYPTRYSDATAPDGKGQPFKKWIYECLRIGFQFELEPVPGKSAKSPDSTS